MSQASGKRVSMISTAERHYSRKLILGGNPLQSERVVSLFNSLTQSLVGGGVVEGHRTKLNRQSTTQPNNQLMLTTNLRRLARGIDDTNSNQHAQEMSAQIDAVMFTFDGLEPNNRCPQCPHHFATDFDNTDPRRRSTKVRRLIIISRPAISSGTDVTGRLLRECESGWLCAILLTH